MEFLRDATSGTWSASTNFRNRAIVVRVSAPELQPDHVTEEIALAALDRIESRWAEVEELFRKQVYATYMSSWIPEDGVPLSDAAFVANLQLSAINVDVEDETTSSQFLYFEDGGALGGHSVEVFLDGIDHSISADIVG